MSSRLRRSWSARRPRASWRPEHFRELGERIVSGRQYTDTERAEFLARHDQFDV